MGELQAALAWLLEDLRRPVGIALALVGVGAVIWQFRMIQLVVRSENWPAVTGRVLHSEACIVRQAGEVTMGVRASDIRYAYRVDGVDYESDVVCLGGQFDTSGGSPARDRLERYPAGQEVEVFYNPDDPRQACLERTAEAPFLVVAVGAVFVLVGVLVTLGVIGG